MQYKVDMEPKGFPGLFVSFKTEDIEELQTLPDSFEIISEDTETGKFTIQDTKMPGRDITLGGYEIIQQYIAALQAMEPEFNMFSGINQVSATMISLIGGKAEVCADHISFHTTNDQTHVLVSIRWGGFMTKDITGVAYEDDIKVIYDNTFMSNSAVFDNETILIIEKGPDDFSMEYLESIIIKRD